MNIVVLLGFILTLFFGYGHSQSCPAVQNVARVCSSVTYSGAQVLIDASYYSDTIGNCSCTFSTTADTIRIVTYTAPNFNNCNSAIRLYSDSGNAMRFQCLMSGTYLDTSAYRTGGTDFETFGPDFNMNYCLVLEHLGTPTDSITISCNGLIPDTGPAETTTVSVNGIPETTTVSVSDILETTTLTPVTPPVSMDSLRNLPNNEAATVFTTTKPTPHFNTTVADAALTNVSTVEDTHGIHEHHFDTAFNTTDAVDLGEGANESFVGNASSVNTAGIASREDSTLSGNESVVLGDALTDVIPIDTDTKPSNVSDRTTFIAENFGPQNELTEMINDTSINKTVFGNDGIPREVSMNDSRTPDIPVDNETTSVRDFSISFDNKSPEIDVVRPDPNLLITDNMTTLGINDISKETTLDNTHNNSLDIIFDTSSKNVSSDMDSVTSKSFVLSTEKSVPFGNDAIARENLLDTSLNDTNAISELKLLLRNDSLIENNSISATTRPTAIYTEDVTSFANDAIKEATTVRQQRLTTHHNVMVEGDIMTFGNDTIPKESLADTPRNVSTDNISFDTTKPTVIYTDNITNFGHDAIVKDNLTDYSLSISNDSTSFDATKPTVIYTENITSFVNDAIAKDNSTVSSQSPTNDSILFDTSKPTAVHTENGISFGNDVIAKENLTDQSLSLSKNFASDTTKPTAIYKENITSFGNNAIDKEVFGQDIPPIRHNVLISEDKSTFGTDAIVKEDVTEHIHNHMKGDVSFGTTIPTVINTDTDLSFGNDAIAKDVVTDGRQSPTTNYNGLLTREMSTLGNDAVTKENLTENSHNKAKEIVSDFIVSLENDTIVRDIVTPQNKVLSTEKMVKFGNDALSRESATHIFLSETQTDGIIKEAIKSKTTDKTTDITPSWNLFSENDTITNDIVTSQPDAVPITNMMAFANTVFGNGNVNGMQTNFEYWTDVEKFNSTDMSNPQVNTSDSSFTNTNSLVSNDTHEHNNNYSEHSTHDNIAHDSFASGVGTTIHEREAFGHDDVSKNTTVSVLNARYPHDNANESTSVYDQILSESLLTQQNTSVNDNDSTPEPLFGTTHHTQTFGFDTLPKERTASTNRPEILENPASREDTIVNRFDTTTQSIASFGRDVPSKSEWLNTLRVQPLSTDASLKTNTVTHQSIISSTEKTFRNDAIVKDASTDTQYSELINTVTGVPFISDKQGSDVVPKRPIELSTQNQFTFGNDAIQRDAITDIQLNEQANDTDINITAIPDIMAADRVSFGNDAIIKDAVGEVLATTANLEPNITATDEVNSLQDVVLSEVRSMPSGLSLTNDTFGREIMNELINTSTEKTDIWRNHALASGGVASQPIEIDHFKTDLVTPQPIDLSTDNLIPFGKDAIVKDSVTSRPVGMGDVLSPEKIATLRLDAIMSGGSSNEKAVTNADMPFRNDGIEPTNIRFNDNTNSNVDIPFRNDGIEPTNVRFSDTTDVNVDIPFGNDAILRDSVTSRPVEKGDVSSKEKIATLRIDAIMSGGLTRNTFNDTTDTNVDIPFGNDGLESINVRFNETTNVNADIPFRNDGIVPTNDRFHETRDPNVDIPFGNDGIVPTNVRFNETRDPNVDIPFGNDGIVPTNVRFNETTDANVDIPFGNDGIVPTNIRFNETRDANVDIPFGNDGIVPTNVRFNETRDPNVDIPFGNDGIVPTNVRFNETTDASVDIPFGNDGIVPTNIRFNETRDPNVDIPFGNDGIVPTNIRFNETRDPNVDIPFGNDGIVPTNIRFNETTDASVDIPFGNDGIVPTNIRFNETRDPNVDIPFGNDGIVPTNIRFNETRDPNVDIPFGNDGIVPTNDRFNETTDANADIPFGNDGIEPINVRFNDTTDVNVDIPFGNDAILRDSVTSRPVEMGDASSKEKIATLRIDAIMSGDLTRNTFNDTIDVNVGVPFENDGIEPISVTSQPIVTPTDINNTFENDALPKETFGINSQNDINTTIPFESDTVLPVNIELNASGAIENIDNMLRIPFGNDAVKEVDTVSPAFGSDMHTDSNRIVNETAFVDSQHNVINNVDHVGQDSISRTSSESPRHLATEVPVSFEFDVLPKQHSVNESEDIVMVNDMFTTNTGGTNRSLVDEPITETFIKQADSSLLGSVNSVKPNVSASLLDSILNTHSETRSAVDVGTLPGALWDNEVTTMPTERVTLGLDVVTRDIHMHDNNISDAFDARIREAMSNDLINQLTEQLLNNSLDSASVQPTITDIKLTAHHSEINHDGHTNIPIDMGGVDHRFHTTTSVSTVDKTVDSTQSSVKDITTPSIETTSITANTEVGTRRTTLPDIIPGVVDTIDPIVVGGDSVPTTPARTRTTTRLYNVMVDDQMVTNNRDVMEDESESSKDQLNVSLEDENDGSFFDTSNKTYIVIVIAVAGLLVLIAIIIVIIRNKNKSRTDKGNIQNGASNHNNAAYENDVSEAERGNVPSTANGGDLPKPGVQVIEPAGVNGADITTSGHL